MNWPSLPVEEAARPALIEDEWPELVHKPPPAKPQS
jgi:hypothetical protein